MTDLEIIKHFKAQKLCASERNRLIVNSLRHARMDGIVFDIKNNFKYFAIYCNIMHSISKDYGFLFAEVQRQIAKKRRWQNRRQNGDTTRSEDI